MKSKSRQSGVTLTEMTVVVAVISLLVTFGLPAIRAFYGAFESEGSVRSLISAGLASARAIAAREQHYAGIRFQQDLAGNQYMIFIVHDIGRTGLANGFRAVEGIKPIKLPDSVGVMDSTLIKEYVNLDANWEPTEIQELNNLTTFSIIFSPSGKMVMHEVRTRNKDGYLNSNDGSADEVFNTVNNVRNGIAMFFQDYGADGFQEESSRNSFIIYDRKEFKHAYENGQGYSDCLEKLVPETVYVNPYTGTIISVD